MEEIYAVWVNGAGLGKWRKKTGSKPRCRMRPYLPLPLWLVKRGPSAFYYLSHLTFRMRGRPVGRMDLVCDHPGRHFPRFPTPASDTSFCANIRHRKKKESLKHIRAYVPLLLGLHERENKSL